jgi:multidrug resistance efflux pump
VAVRRGDIVHSFVANGRVESDRTVEILPRVSARIAEVRAREGDEVEAGQILATLDDEPLRRRRDAARARRDEVFRGARPEEIDQASAKVAEAEQEVRLASAKLAEVERGARPEDREEAEAQLALAKTAADHAAREWERVKGLTDVSESERDAFRRAHEEAQATLRQAQARRDRVVNGATKEEKDQVRAAAEAAKARLDQAKAVEARLRKGATDEERRAAEAELAALESELAQTSLVSPVQGVVLRRYREPGEMATPATPILVVAETASRIVRIEVSEGDVFKLRLGQPVAFTADAYPGRRWTGTVARIAPVLGRKTITSENPREKSDVKVLEVRIAPDAPLDLPINLPVEARVREVVRQRVLVLPARAVDGGQVRLPGGGLRTVEVGARDDAFVEVVSGLAEGEKVVIPK